jgi:hypothetical protein
MEFEDMTATTDDLSFEGFEEEFAAALTGEDTTEQDNAAADNTDSDTTEQENTADMADTAQNDGADEGPADTTKGEKEQKDTPGSEKGEEVGEKERKEPEQTYTLKILGKTREVRLPELLQLASKGGDYDRIRQGYDDFKADAMALRELAASEGKTTAELLDSLQAGRRDREIRQQTEQYVNDGMDEGVARILAEQQQNNKELLQRLNQAQSQNQNKAISGVQNVANEELVNQDGKNGERVANETENEEKNEVLSANIRHLVDVYGVSELPQEVIKISVEKNILPFEAYQTWLLEQAETEKKSLQTQLEQAKTAEKNRKKSSGSMGGGVSGGENDDFLAGLMF